MIVIGSRGSQLALWQARHIAACLQKLGVETRLEIIKTTGDKITDVPLAEVGGKGLFTKEIEEALLAGTIDLAVHSLKDMPTGLPAGLTLAAIPEREDPRDALIGKPLAELGAGSEGRNEFFAARGAIACAGARAGDREFCAAMSTHGSASWMKGNTMPSCSRRRDCGAWVGRIAFAS